MVTQKSENEILLPLQDFVKEQWCQQNEEKEKGLQEERLLAAECFGELQTELWTVPERKRIAQEKCGVYASNVLRNKFLTQTF